MPDILNPPPAYTARPAAGTVPQHLNSPPPYSLNEPLATREATTPPSPTTASQNSTSLERPSTTRVSDV